MILQMYSVFDKAVNAYMPPFHVRSRGEALRSFTDAANDEKHQFARHSNDYHLYYIGEFDDASGTISGTVPERVVSAVELLDPDIVLGNSAQNGGVSARRV